MSIINECKQIVDAYKLTNGPIFVYILTPCYGGLVYVNYTNKLDNHIEV